MKTYTTSKDYARLVRLLDEGHKVAMQNDYGSYETAMRLPNGVYQIGDVFTSRKIDVQTFCEANGLEYIPPIAKVILPTDNSIIRQISWFHRIMFPNTACNILKELEERGWKLVKEGESDE